MRLFFEIFLSLQRVPLSIFWCFAPEWMLKKPKGPPFTFFGTMRLLKILIFRFWKILKFFNVSEGSLLHFFDILQQTGFSKSPKSPPFYNFKNFVRFLSLGYGADFRRSRLVFHSHEDVGIIPVNNF